MSEMVTRTCPLSPAKAGERAGLLRGRCKGDGRDIVGARDSGLDVKNLERIIIKTRYIMKTALITGITGQDGSYLAEFS